MNFTVRKIPLEQLLSVLILMRDSGEEFINLECEMNPIQDNVQITPYIYNDPNQMKIDASIQSEDQMKTIKNLLNGSNR
jgi:hypothetical protein